MRKLEVIQVEGGWTWRLTDDEGNAEEGPPYDTQDAARAAGENHNAGTW